MNNLPQDDFKGNHKDRWNVMPKTKKPSSVLSSAVVACPLSRVWLCDPMNSCVDVRDPASIPGSERFPWKRTRQPIQDSCLENPLGQGNLAATVQTVAKSWRRLKGLGVHARATWGAFAALRGCVCGLLCWNLVFQGEKWWDACVWSSTLHTTDWGPLRFWWE